MSSKTLIKRITVSMPETTFQKLRAVADGNVSSFVTDAVEDKLVRVALPEKSSVETFRELQDAFVALGLSKDSVAEMKRTIRDGLQ